MKIPSNLILTFTVAALLSAAAMTQVGCTSRPISDLGEMPSTGLANAAPQQIVEESPSASLKINKPTRLAYDLEIYVDPSSAVSDPDGSIGKPYTTLAAAFTHINSTRSELNPSSISANGIVTPYVEPSIHLKVAPGVYREGDLSIASRDSAVLIESSDPNREVVVSGADVWTDWTTSDLDNSLLEAEWPYRWGEFSFGGWPDGELKNLQPMGKRSEMVFVNGELMKQVEPNPELGAGEFYVDFEKSRLVLRLPQGTDATSATIEVSTRPHLLFVGSLPRFTLRNMAFVQACNGDMHPELGSWAVLFSGEPEDAPPDHTHAPVLVTPERNYLRNVVIERCRFEWNNHSGITMANIIGLIVRNSNFDNNGSAGMGINRARNVLYEDCTFDGNNWRIGKLGHTYGWAPAGTKQLFMADTTFRRCSFSRNYATGLWLDFGNENILVEDCVISDNWNVGLYFEASYGPCIVRDSEITRNAFSQSADYATGGVLFAESKQLTLDNCLIADNANFQIGVRSRERLSSGYWSQTRFDGLCEHLTVKNSTIRGIFYAPDNVPEWFTDAHRTSSLIGPSVHSDQEWYKQLIPTYVGENNTFIHGHSDEVFGIGGDFGLTRVDLNGWQELTGQDLNSAFYETIPRSSWKK